MARPARKRPPDPAPKPPKALVPVRMEAQPHGGELRRGGTNRGGTGRPPNEIRNTIRQLLDTHGLDRLKQVLTGTVPMQTKCKECGFEPKTKLRLTAEVPDQLRVVELLTRFGIGLKDEISIISPEVRLRVEQMVALIATELPGMIRDSASPEDCAELLLNRLDGIWE